MLRKFWGSILQRFTESSSATESATEAPLAGVRIELVPLGSPDAKSLLWLAAELTLCLGLECCISAPALLPAKGAAGDPGRVASGALVDLLIERYPPDAVDYRSRWSLGITDADLFAPARPFVFGEATLGGCCAVVSTARLGRSPGMDPYDAEPDAHLFRERLLKEAVHELGHIAGLPHCNHSACVMFASYDLTETDRKEPCFCTRCEHRLRSLVPAGRA